MNFMANIKAKSTLLHSVAENTGYIKKLVDCTATVEGYSEYLLNLHRVYKAIENALVKNENNPNVKPFVTTELFRSELIQKDIEVLLGDKASSVSVLASTEAYVDRINEVSENNPELVIAHAYTRFLADLFGGRVFFSLLSEKYNIKNEALNYYTFPKIQDPKEYVMNYHNMLNTLNLSDDLKDKFVHEINNSYIYNIAISNELDIKLNK